MFFSERVQKGIARLLIVNLLLPLVLIAFFSVPVFAAGLTKDDAYKGLLIAMLLVVVSKVAKAIIAEDDSKVEIEEKKTGFSIPYKYTGEDLELLARVIYAESRGEPYLGQVAVGAVVLNRVKSPDFPDTVRKVIYAPGQFSSVADGQINLTPNATAYKAAKEALAGKDPTFGALYFYNPKTARHLDFFKKLTVTVQIGNHVFAK